MSQSELACYVGVSQATISRLEATETYPTNIRLLSKIANTLKVSLDALLPEEALREMLSSSGDTFCAFCPNPFCKRNEHGLTQKGTVKVNWQSWQIYDSERFDRINFCLQCGEELVKECRNCKSRFESKDTRFCTTCGEKVCNRPTEAEVKQIRSIHKPLEPPPEPLSPSDESIPF